MKKWAEKKKHIVERNIKKLCYRIKLYNNNKFVTDINLYGDRL